MRLQRPRKLQWLSLLLLLVNEVSGQLLSLLLLPALGIPNLTLCCAGNSSSLNHRCASRGSLPQSLLTACFVPKVSQWHVEAAGYGSSRMPESPAYFSDLFPMLCGSRTAAAATAYSPATAATCCECPCLLARLLLIKCCFSAGFFRVLLCSGSGSSC